MSLFYNDKHRQVSGNNRKIHPPKAIQKGAKNDRDDDRRCETLGNSSDIKNLPVDCLTLVFRCLKTRDDRASFGLTCRRWLHIQNDNEDSLSYRGCPSFLKDPKISPKSISIIVCKLLIRFQHLKYLSLCPKINFVISKSQFFSSEVLSLHLNNCSEYSDIELSLIFSWFPRLTCINLASTHITDKGLYALSTSCSSLETVDLRDCHSITDAGLSSLIQNCRKLATLYINFCSSITGIGFLGCAHALKHLEASGCKLTQEGINAIVSGGGLEYLILSTPYEVAKVGEGSINTEAVITISKGCPLLKKLDLTYAMDVQLEGWEAIGQNCKKLEFLHIYGGNKLCGIGLQALYNGCDKLRTVSVENSSGCSTNALGLFKHKVESRNLM
ncbi:hypothetical protein MKW98_028979 [Papaver atlanticum]|uniref:Uncharacterized protein n=1 Tax=Papaver atlanticum TaxID=357466 RepID=A0AAD4TLS9_9MAGN|nr:hypothetical protein MKW98_028979 [Papaver atlanticum]